MTAALAGPSPAPDPLKPRLLAAFAHPDDETLASGILVRAVEAGLDVTVVYVTSGDAGKDQSGRNLSGEALATEREQETRAALTALGIPRDPRFLKFPDGKVSSLEKEVLERMIPLLEELDPTVVLTFGSSGFTGHADHIATGRITENAFDRSGKGTFLVHTVVSRSRSDKLSADLPEFGLVWVADDRVTEVIECPGAADRKSAAMRAHRTQFTPKILERVARWFTELPYEELVLARGPKSATPIRSLLEAPR